MDELGFITPATIKALLVPVESITQSAFLQYWQILGRIKDVRAVDLTHIPGKFNPQAYPQGRIFYSFLTRDETTDSFFLHDFEPFRKTSIVLGIAQWNKDLDDDKIRSMKSDFAKQYTSAITNAIIIFNCPHDFLTKIAEVYTVHKELDNLETVVCDVTSRFLSNFSRYVSAYEHTTLRSPGSLTGNVSKPSQQSLLEKQRKRLTGSFEINIEKSKQNKDLGRKLKLSANFYLMVGNYKSALSEFCEAIHLLSAANDYLWLASAFDGLAVCLFLLGFIEASFQVPTNITSLIDNTNYMDLKKLSFSSPRPSFQLSSSLTPRSSTISLNTPEISLSSIQSMILNLSKLSSAYYKLSVSENGGYVPPIVITESGLRYATLFVLIGIEGELTKSSLQLAISNSISIDRRVMAGFVDTNHINNLVSESFKSEFQELSQISKLKICSVLIKLFIMMDMNRKACLMINGFINIINNDKKYMIASNFNQKELDAILKMYASNFGICLSSDLDKIEPNSLQLKTLHQIIEFCSKVNFLEGVIKYGSIMLRDFGHLLVEEDQIFLYEDIRSAMTKTGVKPSYWDSSLLVDFIIKDRQLIEGDCSDIFISFKNPFAFPIEIQDIRISTTHPFELEAYVNPNYKHFIGSKSIIIQEGQTQKIPFLLTPQSSGILKIDGIWASIRGCKFQKFTVNPIQTVTYKHKELSIKYDIKNRFFKRDAPKIWELSVVYKQPRLQILNVELEDHVMLLEGEYRQFTITLENASAIEINQLDLKFHDSTTDPLNTLLSKKDLPINEIYELEYYLFVKKPFEILNKSEMDVIKPHQTFSLLVKIWGKRGVTEAKLILDYANQRPENMIKFKRELIIPVKISVYPSVELAGCDILQLTSNTKVSEISNQSCLSYLEKVVSEGSQISDFCILALDFMNMCPEEVEITLQSLLVGSDDPKFQEGTGLIECLKPNDFQCSTNLQTRQNIRLFLPIKRIDFDEDYLNTNIPRLRNKQFVRDYKTPEAEQQFQRHSFWYRDELLKRLRVTWKVSERANNSISAGRCGTIDIRSLKLSSKMLSIIEIDKIQIDLKILDDQNNIVTNSSDLKLSLMYSINVTITNRFKYPVFGMIRHIVVCKNPPYNMDNKVLINGVLQFGIGSELNSGCSRSFDLGLVFLEKGNYEWGTLFDEMSGYNDGNISLKKQHLQRQQLKIKVC